MLEGPKVPSEQEYQRVLEFLNQKLRPDFEWTIDKEYPTALTVSNRHNMSVIVNDDKVVSHAVVKPLIVKTPQMIFKLGAIGSVVTDENFRNQGLSQKILKESIELAQKQNCDLAILWTNLYDFYRKLDFELAGYEISFAFHNQVIYDTKKYKYSHDGSIAPEAIAKLYTQHSVGSIRSIEEIRKFLQIPKTRVYTAWNLDGTLAAYAVEGKGADLTDYIHEWGGGVTAIKNLIGYISQVKGKPFHFITPRHSQNLISELTPLATFTNQGYLGMIRILNFENLANKIKKAFRAVGISDFVLEKRDGHIHFGVASDLYTIQAEKDLVPLLFGPWDWQNQDIFNDKTAQILGQILPLSIWVWGWDSV